MLDGAGWSRFDVTEGPEGCTGQAICLEPGPEGVQGKQRVDLKVQEWHKVPAVDGDGFFYLIWDRSDPPGAPDLQRPKMIDGWPVKLGDGHEWMVPVAAVTVVDGRSTSTLPMGFERNGNGKFVATPKRQYDEFNQKARWWLDNYSGTHQWDDVVRFVSTVLSLNYRVHPDLLAVMEILDTDNTWNVIEVVIGVRSLLESKKKEEAPSSASGT